MLAMYSFTRETDLLWSKEISTKWTMKSLGIEPTTLRNDYLTEMIEVP
jgi:hypothetical protein